MGKAEAFCNPMIKSQSLSEPMSLNCEFHKYFSGFFSTLGWNRMSRARAGIGYFLVLRLFRL